MLAMSHNRVVHSPGSHRFLAAIVILVQVEFANNILCMFVAVTIIPDIKSANFIFPVAIRYAVDGNGIAYYRIAIFTCIDHFHTDFVCSVLFIFVFYFFSGSFGIVSKIPIIFVTGICVYCII
jgi:hypothetical protein